MPRLPREIAIRRSVGFGIGNLEGGMNIRVSSKRAGVLIAARTFTENGAKFLRVWRVGLRAPQQQAAE